MSKSRGAWMAAASLMAIVPAAARAQQAPADTAVPTQEATPAPEASGPGDIVVTGTRASLENAERTKRNADVIVDGISADDISALPDASIADSLVRITGVSSNDQVRGPNNVSIRGLGPDLSLITVNGRILPSGSGDNRRLDLAELPTEGISGAYVQKTPDAKTLEGGIAGVLDLQTIRPLESSRRGLTLVGRAIVQDVSAQLSDAHHYGNIGARAEATYVNRLTDNLGVALTYSFLRQFSASAGIQNDSFRIGTGPRLDYNGDGIPDALPTNAGNFITFNDDTRHSALGSVQWDVDTGIRATLDGMFVTDLNYTGPTRFFANNIYNGAGLGASTSETVDATNTVRAFSGPTALYRELVNDNRSFDRTYGGGLNLSFDRGPIKAVFDASYFRADRHIHNQQATVDTDGNLAIQQREPFGYDFTDPDNLKLTFTPLTADDYALNQLLNNFSQVRDAVRAVRGDFTYTPEASSFLRSIAAGFRVDRRDHANSADASTYTFASLTARPDLDSSYLALGVNPARSVTDLIGGLSGASFPYFDINKLEALRNAPGAILNNQATNDLANSYFVRENTAALYGQINIRTTRLSGNAGVRYVITDLTVKGQALSAAGIATPQTFNNTFRYFLPAVNLRYELTPTLQVRGAFSKTLSRQQFVNLSPNSSVDLTTITSGQPIINQGNPNLKPFTATGFDLSVEWAPNRATNIAVAAYEKELKNFLVPTSVPTPVVLPDGTIASGITQSVVNDPTNRRIVGVELNVRRDLTFLPGVLRNTGIQFNVNYNTTEVPQTATSIINNAGAANTAVGTTASVSPDQFSSFVANGQLYYSIRRLDLRLAYRYFQPYYRAFFNSIQAQPLGQLDFSGGLTLVRNVRLIGSATNLLGARITRYIADYRNGDNTGLLQLNSYQGRQFTLGVRATF